MKTDISSPSIGPNVLIIISGSIAAYKTCHIISRLIQQGIDVNVVMTQSAQEFIGLATIEGLIGKPAYTDTFQRGEYMAHIHLVRSANLILLCPATANIINSMSAGIAHDLATTLFLAHDFTKPWLISSAMITSMYRHPTSQTSLRTLQEFGCEIFGTAHGMLACGEVGEGKLDDPDHILAEGLRRVRPSVPIITATPKHILITAGGTKEYIDPVRVLTNVSTGTTGTVLADALAHAGHHITLLMAEDSVQAQHPSVRQLPYRTFTDIQTMLQSQLSQNHFDLCIHSAAISDYSPTVSAETKLDSHGEELTLTLKRNPKLIGMIRTWSKNPAIRLIAFKLTADSQEQQVERRERLYASVHPDMVIANDIATLPAWTSFLAGKNHAVEEHASGTNRKELAEYITTYIASL